MKRISVNFNRILKKILWVSFADNFLSVLRSISEFHMLIFNLEILLNTLISERLLVKPLGFSVHKILLSSIKVNLTSFSVPIWGDLFVSSI